jgi:glycosyltransferase involved in cell wall biosynthesis
VSASFSVSLVVPVYNESQTIAGLIVTIRSQSLQPDAIIFVDGGSSDDTVQKIKDLTAEDERFQLIEAGRAMPGQGRNIGTERSGTEWIAYTDAGITLHPDWLKEMVLVAKNDTNADIVYGNYSPEIKTFFEQVSAFAYVPAMLPGLIRGKSIASCLLRKKVWELVGGFPDFRAAEDLIFMEAARKKGFANITAPKAMMYWQLRPGLKSTVKKFVLYSRHNVYAGKQKDWHCAILKQYILVSPFILAAIFHSGWWMAGILLWLVARTFKRLWPHRHEYGITRIFNPFYFLGTMLMALVIDIATFTGWAHAKTNPGLQ